MSPKGPKEDGKGLIGVLILALFLKLSQGQTVSPTEQVAPSEVRQATASSNASSDLSESADSTGQQPASITSLHQVWTSTSSGRLDELSPEIIGKLRQDVPFLAAYALRPRLVGAITSQPSGAIQPLESYVSSQVQQPPTAQQVGSGADLVEKLGDFSELKVETSSLSKSEHHHKRKTSLKRQENELKRRVQATTNRLLKRSKGGVIGKSSSSMRVNNRAGRLRRKLARGNLQHHMNVIRHGRYLQDDGTKGGGGGGVDRQTPFYSKGKDKKSQANGNDGRDEVGSRNDEDDMRTIEEAELNPPAPRRVGDADVDEVEGDTVTVMPKFDGVDDDPELPVEENEGGDGEAAEADEAEADDARRGRRVNRERPNEGDGGGGMVLGGGIGATTGGAGGPSSSGGGSRSEGSEMEGSQPSGKVPVKPGVEFADEDDDEDGQDVDDKGGRGNKKTSDGRDNDGDKGDDDDAGNRHGGGSGGKQKPRDGAGGGDDGDDGDANGDDDNRGGSSRPANKRPSKGRDDGSDDMDYRDQMDEPKRKDKEGGGGGGKSHHCLDHHDDGSYNHHDDHHNNHDHHHDSIKWLEDAVAGKPGYDYPILSRANATNFNCHDQKYPGYYADVEARCQVFHICQADGRQDSFLCPNGTIFSQKTTVCVWWNSFDCEEAPKYYDLNALLYKTSPQSAMAEGAMSDLTPRDSLAPAEEEDEDGENNNNNKEHDDSSSIDGLIKAMKRRTASSGAGGTSAGAMEMMRMVPDGGTGRGGASDDADAARPPKTKPSGAGATMDMIGGPDEDDEANGIQRKTPANAIGGGAAQGGDDDGAEANEGAAAGVGGGSSSATSRRLRRLSRGKGEPRKRRRRASVRQSPPKLKSKRFQRVSRRWKLRHNPTKPKRRA